MKNRAAILLLFLANSISGLAQGMTMIAIPWYFSQRDDMSRFGLFYIIVCVVSFVWVPYCGTLIDRFDRKKIYLAVTAVSGLVLASTAYFGYQLGALPWYVVGSMFMFNFLNYNIHYPNLYAFVQEITEPSYYSKITSYLEIQGQLTSVLAGGGAAMLLEGTLDGHLNIFGIKFQTGIEVAPWAIHEIFALDAMTYFAAFSIICLLSYVPLLHRTVETGKTLQRLKVGFDYLKENKNMFIFGVASYAIFATVLIVAFYTAAVYVAQQLNAGGDVYATSEMYYAIGAVSAGITTNWLFRKTPIPKAIIILTLLTGGLYAVLVFSKSVFVFYAMFFLLGLSNAGTRILRVTYLFRHIPNQVYGRAGSIFFLTNILIRIGFLSLFALPFFQDGPGVTYTFAMMSVFLFLAAAVLIMYYDDFKNMKENEALKIDNKLVENKS